MKNHSIVINVITIAVSYNCKTGPSELINNGVNGYLVPVETGSKGLSEKLTILMDDEKKRITMGEKAIETRERYSTERITIMWDSVLWPENKGTSINT